MLISTELTEHFPYAQFHPDWHLVTWYPTGVLDNERSDKLIDFLELAEKAGGEPFNRYTDMCGYSRVQIDLDHIVRLARRRRRYRGPKVKSALSAVRLISLTIARMYQELMAETRIEVCIFRDRAAAAKWLDVPEWVLLRPKEVSA
jgi:hypothetical protein